MDYSQSRRFIDNARQYGNVLGLDNMKELMARLSHPEHGLSFIHVTGTNGKGSVIAYLYSVLTEAGYRIGRSPLLLFFPIGRDGKSTGSKSAEKDLPDV